MSAPLVVSTVPNSNATGVVLGAPIVVTFDQPVDPATVTNATFSVTGPGQTQILTPEQLISQNPSAINSRDVVTGVISFSPDNTQVTFTPDEAFNKNLLYTVLLVGGDGLLTSAGIANPLGAGGLKMAQSYQWTFTTSDLNITTPPVVSPIPVPPILGLDPNAIRVIPRSFVDNDLSAEIQIIFPAKIDPNSFAITDILASIEPVLGDLSVVIPSGLSISAAVQDNMITISVTGWPA
jgi:hypothetical protein